MKTQFTNAAIPRVPNLSIDELGGQVWSAERIKKLTMNRITAKNYKSVRARRPIAALVACVALALTLSVSAFAANAFGIRDFVGNFFGWNVNEAVGVLELDTTEQFSVGRWGGEGSPFEMTVKSLTLSSTEMTFSYTFKSDNGVTPLPSMLAAVMSDGSEIDAAITGTSIDGDLLTGTARFPASVNLDDVCAVIFGGPENESAVISRIIPVNSDVPWPLTKSPDSPDSPDSGIIEFFEVHSGETP